MSMLDHVTTGPVRRPRRALIYGVQGVGKSTFGAMAEAPIFIQTEDGLSDIDCSRFPIAATYADVLAALGALYSEAHEYRTVVIDSLDWLERLIWADVCAKRGVDSIEDILRRDSDPGSQTERTSEESLPLAHGGEPPQGQRLQVNVAATLATVIVLIMLVGLVVGLALHMASG